MRQYYRTVLYSPLGTFKSKWQKKFTDQEILEIQELEKELDEERIELGDDSLSSFDKEFIENNKELFLEFQKDSKGSADKILENDDGESFFDEEGRLIFVPKNVLNNSIIVYEFKDVVNED